MIGRVIGILFLMIAAIVLLRDVLNFADTGEFALLSTDQLWFSFLPENFTRSQQWGHFHLYWLWDPVLTTLLSLPTFVVTAAIGILFLLAARKPRPRKRRTRTARGPLRT